MTLYEANEQDVMVQMDMNVSQNDSKEIVVNL